MLVLLLILGLTVYAHGSSLNQPFLCPQSFSGLLPNPTECESFYSCENGTTTIVLCHGGLHFNRHTSVCDWPEMAGCKLGPGFHLDIDSDDAYHFGNYDRLVKCPNNCHACPIPHPTDCSKFYRCSNGKAYGVSCSNGLHFNPNKHTCDFPDSTVCVDKTEDKTTTTTTTTTTTIQSNEVTATNSNFKCPLSQGLFPNPSDCRTFYHCDHGIPYLKDCPSILHFNPKLLVCDWPERAGCQLGGNPDSPVPDPGETSENECDCDCCVYPDPTDCSKYFRCLNKKQYQGSCSGGLLFNPAIENCDLKNNVECKDKVPPLRPLFTCPTSQGLFPNPKDCGSFYHCDHGIAHWKKCPANLHFNPTLLVCDWPENAGCGKPQPQLQPTPNPDPNFTCTCDCCVVPNANDCSSYYRCNDGQGFLQKCPAGLLFNPEINSCDFESNVQCPNPSIFPPVAECPRPQGLFPNPVDCRSFYHCDHNIPYLKQCPANLHFNKGLLVCDWPENAGCLGPVPTPPDDKPINGTCPCTCCILPDPDHCQKFYLCLDKRLYQRTCSKGLHFNAHSKTCEPEESFKCTIDSVTFTCPKDDSHCLHQNPDSCTTYYYCELETAYLKHCPPGLYFNKNTRICDWPKSAGCNNNNGGGNVTSICVGGEEPLYSNPDHCGSFIQCSNGRPYVMPCPDNLHFNEQKQICDWPEQAGCEPGLKVTPPAKTTAKPPPSTTRSPIKPTPKRTTQPATKPPPKRTTQPATKPPPKRTTQPATKPPPKRTTQPATKPPPKPTTTKNPICKTSQGLFPNPQDCRTFYHCDYGFPFLKKCPSILHFNPILLVCDWPENAKCIPGAADVVTNQPNNQTSDGDCDCECCVYPDPHDCRKYTRCIDRKAYPGYCSGGLLFNSDIENCDLENNVDCKVTPPPLGTCSCPNSQGLFPNPNDCGSFCHCDHGIPHLKPCPANLHFNPTLLVCDWPENAGCGVDVKLPPPETPVADIECHCDCCVLPNSDDCSSFYRCNDGKAFLQTCPTGLLFNTEINSCDFESNVKCPNKTIFPVIDSFPCTTSQGLFPNPLDCGSFYHCDHNIPYLKQCPGNLHFNKYLLVCDWPEKAGCEKPLVDVQLPEPVNGTCSCLCCILHDPDDCSRYYLCKDSQLQLLSCSSGLKFNPHTKNCEPEDSFKCSSDNPTKFECPLSQGLFPNPDDCTTFFDCDHSTAYLKHCPPGLHFNKKLKVCDWPISAGCMSIGPETPCIGGDEPLKNNPKDCGSFIQCSNGRPYVMPCPANLHFREDKQICDYPELAGCDPNIKPATTTRKPTTTKEPTTKPSFICPSYSGLFPNPKDCRSFYHCDHHIPHLKPCPANLHFNPTLLVCDWPESAGCGKPPKLTTTTTNTITKAPPTPLITFKCPSYSGLFPNPKDCRTFYHCDHWKPHLKHCSGNLHFNPTSLECDWPETAGCGKPPKPTTTSTKAPPTLPTIVITWKCPDRVGLYPNPDSCRSFYHCDHYRPHLKICPANLHFNPTLLVCDWPEQAGCGKPPVSTTVSTSEVPVPDDTICPATCVCRRKNPKDCSTFFECKDKKPYLRKCPGGLYYNENTEMCDLPKNVRC